MTILEEAEAMAVRLETPFYWMSGSEQGHEGDNNTPFEAAALLRRMIEQMKGEG